MVPKINKNPQKRRPRKRFEKVEQKYEKYFPGAEAFGRTNRGRNIIRATQPTNQPTDYLNGRSNSLPLYCCKRRSKN